MHQEAPKKNRLTLYIGIALVLGIVTGFILNKTYTGTENEQIANAELQTNQLLAQMKPFEQIKDSILFTSLNTVKTALSAQKKSAEANLLNSPDGAASRKLILQLADSLKVVNQQLSGQTDTASTAYKSLLKQREIVAIQKSENIKARDKKLDWFTILADVFLRLIKNDCSAVGIHHPCSWRGQIRRYQCGWPYRWQNNVVVFYRIAA